MDGSPFTAAVTASPHSTLDRRQLVRAGRVFFDERWSRNRTVTALDWSRNFPELLLTAYHRNDGDSREPDGVCLVWNQKFSRATPEYIFHCQSPVTTAMMAPFQANLVIGGTYSGQIVLWDNRYGDRFAVCITHQLNCVCVCEVSMPLGV